MSLFGASRRFAATQRFGGYRGQSGLGQSVRSAHRGDENIYPRELEELLFRHPKVGDVAVVGLPDQRWGEVGAAFIRPPPGMVIDKDELHDYMREHLAPHRTPRHWFVLDTMPLTGSGKIQKFKLREQWSKGEMKEL